MNDPNAKNFPLKNYWNKVLTIFFRCVKATQCHVQICDSNNELATGDGLITEIFGTRSLEDDIFGDIDLESGGGKENL